MNRCLAKTAEIWINSSSQNKILLLFFFFLLVCFLKSDWTLAWGFIWLTKKHKLLQDCTHRQLAASISYMSPIKKVNSNNKQPPKTISINEFVGLLVCWQPMNFWNKAMLIKVPSLSWTSQKIKWCRTNLYLKNNERSAKKFELLPGGNEEEPVNVYKKRPE